MVVVVFVAAACLVPTFGFSQAGTNGTITGTVADSSGALIPGVNIVLKYPANVSDLEVSTTTDEKGDFRFLSVPPGVGYTVRAELTGFKTGVVSNIEVRPGIASATHFTMQVGAVTEEVSITAESPLINLESSQVSEGLSYTLTADLPLLRRDFTEVSVLFQGIQHSASDDSGFFVQFHSRGAPTTSNGYRVDGMNIVTPYLGRVGSKMSMTAVQNMEFITGGFNAEYGEQPGSVVNMVTKTGGNKFTADYTTLYRAQALTSNVDSGLPNQVEPKSLGFGFWQEAAVGGALKKDKLYFFDTYQLTDENLGNLVAPKTRHSYFNDEFLKFTLQQNDKTRWDLVVQGNPGNQYGTSFQNSQISLETEAQQRVTIKMANLKNTRAINDRNVLELTAMYHGLGQEGPADARKYHPKGTFTGEFRSFDRILHNGVYSVFSTGPAAPQTGWEEKRIRGIVKLISSHSNHTFKFGTEDGITRGANWGNNDLGHDGVIIRNLTDRRPINGAVTYSLNIYGRGSLASGEYVAYAQDSWKIRRGVLFEYGFRVDGQTLLGTFNPAPRVGLTIDPTGSGKSRIYANWGFYWELVPGTTYTIGQQVLVTETHTLTNLPAYRKPLPSANADPRDTDPNAQVLTQAMYTGTDTISNRAVVTRAPFDRSPLENAWQVGYDFRLPADIKIGVTYAGNRQHRRNTTLALTNNTFTNSDGRTNYKGLEINVRRTFAHGFELEGNYTRSKTMGDTTSSLPLAQLVYRYALMDWDEPNAGSLTALYVLKGFKFTSVYRYNSGRPYSINSNNLLGLPTTVAFVDNNGQPAGRNIYRTPNHYTDDFTVSRAIGGERFTVSPMFQILNITNHVNVQSVSSTFTTRGQPTNVSDSRQMQFGFTLHF
jgi:hypothetical protein